MGSLLVIIEAKSKNCHNQKDINSKSDDGISDMVVLDKAVFLLLIFFYGLFYKDIRWYYKHNKSEDQYSRLLKAMQCDGQITVAELMAEVSE